MSVDAHPSSCAAQRVAPVHAMPRISERSSSRAGGDAGWSARCSSTAELTGEGIGGEPAFACRVLRWRRACRSSPWRDPAAARTLPVGVIQARVLDHVAIVAQPRAINPSGHAQHGLTQQVSRESLGRERSEEHTSELQSLTNLVCRLLLEKKKERCRNVHLFQLPDACTKR